jgi:hypothetical protein
LCRPFAFNEDDKIVSIAGKAQVSLFKLMVELVQYYIREQGRKRSALWGTFLGFLKQTTDQYSGGKKCAYQFQQSFIRDFGSESA